jgi:membrane protease YdiL (CAAX protease family)
MKEQPAQAPARRSTLLIILLFGYLYPAFLFGIVVPWMRENTTLNYLLTVISALLFFGLALWALRRDSIDLAGLGFRRAKLYQTLFVPLLTWLVFTVFLIAYSLAAGQVGSEQGGSPFPSSLALLIQQWLFVGIGEELFFRGYLLAAFAAVFTRLPSKWRTLLGVLLSSAAFATFHLPVRLSTMGSENGGAPLVISMLLAFAFGLIFAYIFLRTRNVLLAGLIHGGLNAPLIGMQGDFLPLIISVIVIEIWIFAENRQKRKAVSAAPVLTDGQ